MFLQELTPLFQELVQKPIAFTGGFVSGLLRLNLGDDPLRGWLNQEMGKTGFTGSATSPNNSNGSGPQSINIE
jgi:hypothetical protein